MTPAMMRTLRKEKNMTQLQVAVAVGVSYPAYRLWEAGGTKPTPENLEKLKAVLQGGDEK